MFTNIHPFAHYPEHSGQVNKLIVLCFRLLNKPQLSLMQSQKFLSVNGIFVEAYFQPTLVLAITVNAKNLVFEIFLGLFETPYTTDFGHLYYEQPSKKRYCVAEYSRFQEYSTSPP